MDFPASSFRESGPDEEEPEAREDPRCREGGDGNPGDQNADEPGEDDEDAQTDDRQAGLYGICLCYGAPLRFVHGSHRHVENGLGE